MKSIFLIFVISAISLSVYAQQHRTWAVLHDKTKMLWASEENEQANVISLHSSIFKSNSFFYFSFNDDINKNDRSNWVRTIGLFTESDSELIRKKGDSLKLSDNSLKKLLFKNKTIKVYTWALPKDPKEAARVRVRRVHLCTIMLKP
ncbi:MAG: hypothetical protein QM764_17945 [Chitinophagaceae bacterium]